MAHVDFDGKRPSVSSQHCYRPDIDIGDDLVERMKEGTLKWAPVAGVNYLNWNCRDTIERLGREATSTKDSSACSRPSTIFLSQKSNGFRVPLSSRPAPSPPLAIAARRLGATRQRPATKTSTSR